MKKTVIFGGTFDPPHAGHKHLLKSVLAKGYDEALVLPAFIPPHKPHAADDFQARVEATREYFTDVPHVTVSDIEGRRGGKSYTFETLRILRDELPDSELYLLMGSDMLLSIEKWRNFEEILETTPVISAARTADDAPRIREFARYLESRYPCKIIVYDFDVLELSSTELRSELVKTIRAHNAAHLKPKRNAHVERVAEYALTLAPLHGVNAHAALVAGLAHDCTKYLDDEGQLAYFAENGIALTESERATPKIWHQISGAHFARTRLGVTDEDVLGAIRWHTTGRAGMSRLEKLICLADSIEPGRDYPGVARMRELARTDLDGALLLSFERLLEHVKERGLPVNPTTLEAYEYLKGEKI